MEYLFDIGYSFIIAVLAVVYISSVLVEGGV